MDFFVICYLSLSLPNTSSQFVAALWSSVGEGLTS